MVDLVSLGTNSNTTGATLAITIGAAGVPAGSLIIVCVADASISVPAGSMTDSVPNTYTSAVSADNNNVTTNGAGEIWYAFNISALVNTNTITYTKAVTGSGCAMAAFYANGMQISADPHDTAVKASATGSSTTPSVTSGTPAISGELIIAMVSSTARGNDTFTQDSTNGAYVTPPVRVAASATSAIACAAGGTLINAGSAAKTYAPTLGTVR